MATVRRILRAPIILSRCRQDSSCEHGFSIGFGLSVRVINIACVLEKLALVDDIVGRCFVGVSPVINGTTALVALQVV